MASPACPPYDDQECEVSHVAYRKDGWYKKIDPVREMRWDSETSAIAISLEEETIEERFLTLASAWATETAHVSSSSDLIAHPYYREIVNLGWAVVPYLLQDLESNGRFWFPALFEITKIRPYDSSDVGNKRLMTKAWLEWGRRKNFI